MKKTLLIALSVLLLLTAAGCGANGGAQKPNLMDPIEVTQFITNMGKIGNKMEYYEYYGLETYDEGDQYEWFIGVTRDPANDSMFSEHISVSLAVVHSPHSDIKKMIWGDSDFDPNVATITEGDNWFRIDIIEDDSIGVMVCVDNIGFTIGSNSGDVTKEVNEILKGLGYEPLPDVKK